MPTTLLWTKYKHNFDMYICRNPPNYSNTNCIYILLIQQEYPTVHMQHQGRDNSYPWCSPPSSHTLNSRKK